MNAACEICRGACCESMVMGLPHGDFGVWLRYHGEPIGKERVELPSPCRMLVEGKCSVWESRPEHCRCYEVGGEACRATVRRRRPGQWQEIFRAMEPKKEAEPR